MFCFKKGLFVVLVFVISVCGICAQSTQQMVVNADSFFVDEDYNGALLEYQRAIFFAGDSISSSLQTKVAQCYVSLGNIEKANEYYSSAIRASINDNQKAEVIFQSALFLLGQCNFYKALMLLNNIPQEVVGIYYRKKNYLLGLSYWGLNDFENSFDSFSKVISSDEGQKKAELNNLREQYGERLVQKPSILPLMSGIIPGSGQLISGRIGEGLSSFVLCVSIGFVSVGSVLMLKNNVVFLNLSPWFLRYYFGGIKRTIEIKDQKRKETRDDVLRRILELVALDEIDVIFPPVGSSRMVGVISLEESASRNYLNRLFNFYKRRISPQDIMDCVYYPSCSEYSLETIRINGLPGFFDAMDRLMRCHLLGHDSFDIQEKSNLYLDPVQKILN